MDLVLPWPPTANNLFKTIVIKGRAMRALSSEGKEYRATVQRIIHRLAITDRFAGRVSVCIHACPPDKRRRDLDNILKAALDALTHVGIWADDSQIDSLFITRGQVKDAGLLYVTIDALPDVQPALPIDPPMTATEVHELVRQAIERPLAF